MGRTQSAGLKTLAEEIGFREEYSLALETSKTSCINSSQCRCQGEVGGRRSEVNWEIGWTHFTIDTTYKAG